MHDVVFLSDFEWLVCALLVLGNGRIQRFSSRVYLLLRGSTCQHLRGYINGRLQGSTNLGFVLSTFRAFDSVIQLLLCIGNGLLENG